MPPRLALVLGLLLALLAPAAAQAATFTVDPADSSACSTSDTTCPTITSAVSAAKAGDTIRILKGTYAESVDVASGKDGLKLEGAGLADVRITGSGTGDVVTLASKSVSLSGVTVDVPGNGQSAVAVNATGARLAASLLQRANASSENVPVVDVAAAGSADLSRLFVIQGAGAAGTPAIRSAGTGLTIADTVVASSTGPAAVFTASDKNVIQRSTLAATAEAADAVQITSAGAGARALTIDSTNIVGGVKGAAVRASTSGSEAGDIALKLRHISVPTLPGADARGIVIDAAATGTPGLPLVGGGAPAGSIAATVTGSIVHNPSSVNNFEPALPVEGTANTATLTFANSDVPQAAASGSDDIGRDSSNTFTEDAKLFLPKSFKLRPDAPVIDKGGPLQAGESTTDVDGEARETDGPDADTTPQSDMGADEYANLAPKAAFGITNKNPRQNEAVGFVSGSTDPEQSVGGGIVEYRWDFGDGTRQTTKEGGVAHTYTQTGTFKATLQVVDAQGAVSEVTAPQEVVVKDGIPPEVSITNPVEGRRLNLRSTYLLGKKRPKPRRLTMLGKVADASGVTSVEVALYVVKRDKVRRAKKKRRARASQTAPKMCEFYSGRLFAKKDCTKEIWLKATVIQGGTWVLRTKKGLRLPAGRYQARVRATDATGLLSSGFTTRAKTLVNFRVR